MTAKLVIESPRLDLSCSAQRFIENLVSRSETKQEAADSIKNWINANPETPCYVKTGFGGSHIWVSDRTNERLAIIYLS